MSALYSFKLAVQVGTQVCFRQRFPDSAVARNRQELDEVSLFGLKVATGTDEIPP